MSDTNIGILMGFLLGFVGVVIAVILIVVGPGSSGHSDYYDPPEPQFTIERRTEYDDENRTLVETTQTTKTFQNVDPEDLEAL
jgi:hypothetical protein